ncbi:hypothetical protein LSUE1_G009752 [Lachnellula suecica]|uniref:Uncharacterized protein n=1 Tax=Lachnellula suecica TaxID=602035 RepID=A0A8T9BQ54_9HELO|nr:hypothetical protein LSUE1_G009752 [Lachnellula suecica]
MASRRPRKSEPAIQSEYSDEESQPLSTERSAEEMMKMGQDVVNKGKKRREDKRKAIEDDHEKRVKEAKGKIDALFAVRNGRVTKYQKNLWTRLETLNAKRENLEQLILASTLSLEQHTLNIANELQAMFDGRMEDIQGENADESA